MNHLSLFSGIGGIDLAAEWAGMKTVAFVEQNKFCQKVLAKHWPHVPIFDDVKTISAKDIHEPIDIISGGFPCQPFSNAGKQLGAKDDRHLWPEYLRLIQELRPTWVVGENVAGIINLALDDVLADMEALGYATRAFVIPACAVGAQHRRERVFIMGHSSSCGCDRKPRRRSGKKFKDRYLRMEEISFPNASSIGQQGQGLHGRCFDTKTHPNGKADWTKYGGQGNEAIWCAEPDVGRVANGIPARLDRLKSLGNAVVPQQIYPIMKAIKDIEEMMA